MQDIYSSLATNKSPSKLSLILIYKFTYYITYFHLLG